jgi:putative spermidine/putrescine transport system permease protein
VGTSLQVRWRDRRGAWLLLLPALLFLGAFLFTPMASMLVTSLRLHVAGRGEVPGSWTVENYARFLRDAFYWRILGRTLFISLEATAACLLLGYPAALFLSRRTGVWRGMLTTLILAPMMISVLVRALGWLLVLGREGVLSQGLRLVMPDPPVFLYTDTGVMIGLAQGLTPLMVLCILSSLLQIDPAVIRAAQDLGANPRQVFGRVTLPLSLPGVVAGCLLVFTLCSSAFAVPALLGGQRVKVMAYIVYENQVLLLNWAYGAAVTVILLVTVGLCVLLYQRWIERQRWSAALR